MRKFFSTIIRQSVAVVLIVVAILGFGVFATCNMSVNLLPDINVPMVCVQVIYPGASATSVESDVTVVLEDGLGSISGVTGVQSYSYDNLSAVVLSFDYGTDTDDKKNDITSKVNGLSLPDGCTTSVYDIDLNSQALAVLSVTGEEDASLDEVYAQAQKLSTSLAAIDGVESVEIKGGGESVIEVVPFAGAELLSLLFVEAFSYGALDLPLGNLTVDGADVQIRNNSDVTSLDDVKNMPVAVPQSYITLLSTIKSVMAFCQTVTEDRLENLTQMYASIAASIAVAGETAPSAEDVAAEIAARLQSGALGDGYPEAAAMIGECPVLASAQMVGYLGDETNRESVLQLIAMRESIGTITPYWFSTLFKKYGLNEIFGITPSQKLLEFVQNTDLDGLPVDADGNAVVAVGQLASVNVTRVYSAYAYYSNGKFSIEDGESIMIEVYKSNGANSSAVVTSVKNECSDFKKSLAADGDAVALDIRLLDDQSEFITDSISNVLVSMVIGGVLAIFIIFVFLKKVKLSLIIAVTMPLSVLAALICMFAMGITLNMVSLGGLAVGIGMLVDNSIVVIECISKHRETGKTAFRAAVDGTCEVGGALIGSTVTTVCVFVPILFAGGLTGEIFADLSWAVIFSLTFSLLIAISVIPTLYSMFGGGDRRMLSGKCLESPPQSGRDENQPEQSSCDGALAQNGEGSPAEEGAGELCPSPVACVSDDTDPAAPAKGKKNAFSKIAAKLRSSFIMDGVGGFYAKVLPKILSKRILTVCIAAAVFAASVFMVTLTGTEFLPSIDKGQIEVNMTYGSNVALEDVREDVLQFADAITKEVGGVSYVSVSVGKNGLLALTDTGIITVQLDSNKDTENAVKKIRALAKKEELGVKGAVTVRQIDGVVASLTSGSNDLSVSITGKDAAVLEKITGEIREKLGAAGFTDITDTVNEKSTQFSLDFDRAKIAEYGLDYQTVVLTLRVGIASYTAATVEIEGEKYSLNVRFDGSVFPAADDMQTALKNLASFTVGYSQGSAVRLSDILTVTEANRDTFGITVEETDACIRRSNGYNTVTISAVLPDTDTGTAGNKMQEIAREVLSKSEYSGYSFESAGISSYLTDAFSGLAVALVVSFFLLYAVMAVQFSSFVKPLIVMASIPFSFTGGFLALVITGTSLNVVSFIGLIMLMGVIVNNAIVMLEKIKQLHDGGTPHFDAVKAACGERLRPILMTTLTTILALIPMAIGVGQGSELMQPLGIVVMGGLLVGTLVTLVLVPAVYCLVYRLSSAHPDGKKRRGKDKETAEPLSEEVPA